MNNENAVNEVKSAKVLKSLVLLSKVYRVLVWCGGAILLVGAIGFAKVKGMDFQTLRFSFALALQNSWGLLICAVLNLGCLWYIYKIVKNLQASRLFVPENVRYFNMVVLFRLYIVLFVGATNYSSEMSIYLFGDVMAVLFLGLVAIILEEGCALHEEGKLIM